MYYKAESSQPVVPARVPTKQSTKRSRVLKAPCVAAADPVLLYFSSFTHHNILHPTGLSMFFIILIVSVFIFLLLLCFYPCVMKCESDIFTWYQILAHGLCLCTVFNRTKQAFKPNFVETVYVLNGRVINVVVNNPPGIKTLGGAN